MSRALDLVEPGGQIDRDTHRALAFGTVSAEDAAIYCALAEEQLGELQPVRHYIQNPAELPEQDTARWFILNRMRFLAQHGEFDDMDSSEINDFLMSLPEEFRHALLIDLVEIWGRLGADQSMFETLKQVTGLEQ